MLGFSCYEYYCQEIVAIVFIVLMTMAVATIDSISEESIAFILSKLERKDIILSKHQREAICADVNARDVIVCLPTGHGKSLIFESVPWYYEFLRGRLEEVRDAVFFSSNHISTRVSNG